MPNRITNVEGEKTRKYIILVYELSLMNKYSVYYTETWNRGSDRVSWKT